MVAACADPAALRTLHNVAVGQFFYMTGETLVDGFLPNWRVCRETLNSGERGHEVWGY